MAKKLFLEWKQQSIYEIKESLIMEARQNLEDWKREEEKSIRRDAAKKSREVIHGRTVEHLIPFTKYFSYNPEDARFLGAPVDFIVFDGLQKGNLTEIIFVEVKSGNSNLSFREKRVHDVIKAGKVRYEIISPEKD